MYNLLDMVFIALVLVVGFSMVRTTKSNITRVKVKRKRILYIVPSVCNNNSMYEISER